MSNTTITHELVLNHSAGGLDYNIQGLQLLIMMSSWLQMRASAAHHHGIHERLRGEHIRCRFALQ